MIKRIDIVGARLEHPAGVICASCDQYVVKMENAVFVSIGHANSELTRSIGLPCAADFPVAHTG